MRSRSVANIILKAAATRYRRTTRQAVFAMNNALAGHPAAQD
jgi:hypothetical protein